MNLKDAGTVKVGDTLVLKKMKEMERYNVGKGTKFMYMIGMNKDAIVTEVYSIHVLDCVIFKCKSGFYIPHTLIKEVKHEVHN